MTTPPPAFAAPPPLLSLATLRWLHAREDAGLGGAPDAATRESHRSLSAASAIHAVFTARGADEASLAPRLLDWSILAAVDEATGRGGGGEGATDADGDGPSQQPLQPPPDIPTLAAEYLSYDQFVRGFLELGQPCLITGVGTGWRAAKEWVKSDEAGLAAPDVDALAAAVPPSTRLPVVSCAAGRGAAGWAGGSPREEWTVEGSAEKSFHSAFFFPLFLVSPPSLLYHRWRGPISC